jgi:hypothetical protein
MLESACVAREKLRREASVAGGEQAQSARRLTHLIAAAEVALQPYHNTILPTAHAHIPAAAYVVQKLRHCGQNSFGSKRSSCFGGAFCVCAAAPDDA